MVDVTFLLLLPPSHPSTPCAARAHLLRFSRLAYTPRTLPPFSMPRARMLYDIYFSLCAHLLLLSSRTPLFALPTHAALRSTGRPFRAPPPYARSRAFSALPHCARTRVTRAGLRARFPARAFTAQRWPVRAGAHFYRNAYPGTRTFYHFIRYRNCAAYPTPARCPITHYHAHTQTTPLPPHFVTLYHTFLLLVCTWHLTFDDLTLTSGKLLENYRRCCFVLCRCVHCALVVYFMCHYAFVSFPLHTYTLTVFYFYCDIGGIVIPLFLLPGALYSVLPAVKQFCYIFLLFV